MFLSEEYKKRIQDLAGITLLDEASFEDKNKLYAKSAQRIPPNVQFIKDAIDQGREIGISFQSNNKKYKMPVTKFRIVQPMTLGYLKNGELALRAYHIIGQSERKAIETGARSAEAENEWRDRKSVV